MEVTVDQNSDWTVADNYFDSTTIVFSFHCVSDIIIKETEILVFLDSGNTAVIQGNAGIAFLVGYKDWLH